MTLTNCCICSEILNETKPISATTCGHVYHSNCLMSWISKRKTCPNCRSRVEKKEVLKLYFDFASTAALDSSVLENEVLNLNAQLNTKECELTALKKEKEDAVTYIRGAEEIIGALQQTLITNENEIARWKLRIEELDAKVLDLESINITLNNTIHNIQSNASTIYQAFVTDESEIEELKGRLESAVTQISELEHTTSELNNVFPLLNNAQSIAKMQKQALIISESEITELKLQVESAELKVSELEQINADLEYSLQFLNNVQLIVSGTQKDVEDMLQQHENGSEVSKEMATYCVILKQQLQREIDSKSKLQQLNYRLEQENCGFVENVISCEEAMATLGKNGSIRQGKTSKSVKENICCGGATFQTPNTNVAKKSRNSCESSVFAPFSESNSMNIVKSTNMIHKSEVSLEKCKGISSVPVKKRKEDICTLKTMSKGLDDNTDFGNPTSGVKKRRKQN